MIAIPQSRTDRIGNPGHQDDAHFNNRSHLAKYLHLNPGAGLSEEKLISYLGI